MKAFVFLLLFIGTLHSKNYPYELSIAAIFKDEMEIIPEWIEYHRLLRVEHFWLYNNGSSDNYLEFLKPYIIQGIVDLIQWPSPAHLNWTAFQARAYNDAILRAKVQSKWMALIDVDEFIVPLYGKSDLKSQLMHFETIPDCGGITLYWLLFGTSHLFDLPAGKILTESLLYRSAQLFKDNYSVKTICRPDRVDIFYIHVGKYLPRYRDYTLDKGHYEMDHPQAGALVIDPIRIHHYWTRNERYLREIKSPRRSLVEGAFFSEERIQSFEETLNTTFDDAILQYIPELKKRLPKPR